MSAQRFQSVYNKSALSQYQQINAQTGVVDADPHRLIQLLLDGALDRIAQAKGALTAGDTAAMGEALGKALGIISGLQASLNKDEGGEIAENLDRLYDYMTLRLLAVHRERKAGPLDEVGGLLGTIRSGWEGIREQASIT
ncbi:MAG: flagellar export chaperone FliS [Pseudomonadales bacterium]|nr:flagellar export chaperone FliS [Pseudomonadales bacterium]